MKSTRLQIFKLVLPLLLLNLSALAQATEKSFSGLEAFLRSHPCTGFDYCYIPTPSDIAQASQSQSQAFAAKSEILDAYDKNIKLTADKLRDTAQRLSSPGQAFYRLYTDTAANYEQKWVVKETGSSFQDTVRKLDLRAQDVLLRTSNSVGIWRARIAGASDEETKSTYLAKLASEYNFFYGQIWEVDQDLQKYDALIGGNDYAPFYYTHELSSYFNEDANCPHLSEFRIENETNQYANIYLSLITDQDVLKFLLDGPQGRGTLRVVCPKSKRGAPSYRYSAADHQVTNEWKWKLDIEPSEVPNFFLVNVSSRRVFSNVLWAEDLRKLKQDYAK